MLHTALEATTGDSFKLLYMFDNDLDTYWMPIEVCYLVSGWCRVIEKQIMLCNIFTETRLGISFDSLERLGC